VPTGALEMNENAKEKDEAKGKTEVGCYSELRRVAEV
jgi:hypothetical protein